MSVEIKSRIAEDREIPPAAKRLGIKATELGWHVDFTYARGDAPGRSVKVVDSLVARFTKGAGRRIVAVYEDGKFRCGLTPQHRLNMRELVAVLEDPESLTAAK